MRIPVDIHQTNEKFSVTVQPKNACKLESADHLWLTFLDQPQSDIVFFAIFTFLIYHILLTIWKSGTVPNNISTFNEELQLFSIINYRTRPKENRIQLH